MKYLKFLLFGALLMILTSYTQLHKYYISNTQIEYVENKKSVQIISRLFIDDFENVLQERYDENLIIDDKSDKLVDVYVERYILEKFKIKINGKSQKLNYLGKKIDPGIVKCYLEIEGVNRIEDIAVTNKLLFDLFIEQQNIVKMKIYKKEKSFILSERKDTNVLNFN